MEKRIFMKSQVLFILFFAIIGMFLLPKQTAFASATAVTIRAIDYDNENILVNNNSNSRIYFATETEAAKGNWEIMDAEAGGVTMIDFSWLSPTTDNILKIKGEEDQTQARITINERTKKLEISINYTNVNNLSINDTIASLVNIMSSEGDGVNPITFNDLEWKKGDGGRWAASSSLKKYDLEKFQVKGTYIFFRIKAINDVETASHVVDGTTGRRVSSEVKVKIAKKTSPVVVGIDGEEFTADIRYGKEYRVTSIDGVAQSPASWIQVTDRTIKTLPLSKVLNKTITIAGVTSLIDGTIAAKAFPAMEFEIRDYSTGKAAASKITEISLKAQRTLGGTIKVEAVPAGTTAADKNIYIGYIGTKNMTITIPSASLTVPYEYCIVKPNDFFEMDHVTWSSITKGTEVKILASKAVDGGIIYVRQKEILSKAATRTTSAVDYELASTYEFAGIKYPSVPTITKANYTFTKEYSGSITFNVTLNEKGRKPFETQIKNIKLGTKEIGFAPPTTSTDADGVSTLTVTLLDTSLKAMTNCYNRAITITYMNGTIDKTSIKLTIQSPTPATTLSATAAPGTTKGTVITVATTVGVGNTRVYVISDTAETGKNTQDKLPTGTGSAFTSGVVIPEITADKYITIYEVTNDTNRYIMKYKSIKITSSLITP